MMSVWLALDKIHPDLICANERVYSILDYTCSQPQLESESQEYAACTFTLNDLAVKFRAAKITPTKVGLFVTLWKRDAKGITCPHDNTDGIDLYIISVRDKNNFGQFVFPKSVLLTHGILSTSEKEGKRGFRVYPPWDLTTNKQAKKTQVWQLNYFLEINDGSNVHLERVKLLYSKK